MKKVNLLSKAEMKKVMGGGASASNLNLPCPYYVVCSNNDPSTETHFPSICCTSWLDAQAYCQPRGWEGPYGCIQGDIDID